MSRRDWLRDFIAVSIEAYNLSADPQSLPIYRSLPDECEPVNDPPRMPTCDRRALLDLAIDAKGIVNGFLKELKYEHGTRRAERFAVWALYGYIRQFGRRHQLQIKYDRAELSKRVRAYKRICH